MSKNQFLNELESLLKEIPESERQDILRDYEEHFQIGLESGKDEAEIVASLGNPKIIAKELRADFHISNAKENKSIGNISRATYSIIGLGFFNLVFVLGPFLGLIGVMIGLYTIPIALVASPILLVIFNGFPANFVEILQMIFLTLTMLGLATLITIGLIYLTQGVYFLILKYLKFNLAIVRGK
ncbi:hypothetical protein BKP45_10100 [Anaerobacillus alkalidiazotrophicus]|uniref:DUF1700 domain-containing protein n=1 Tax=Anaerobacillus alkalidiazotrophicus TaxID=472963 RepID=A0A1S2M6I5_9BACI|nr:DUF1700 domain-containing protein [Anaerobacillus alkalidiazotrophicus]OIJ20130.1 hypothetical protein BKP45_10100 [Anaerobacillus alkalidiazotrophicus]